MFRMDLLPACVYKMVFRVQQGRRQGVWLYRGGEMPRYNAPVPKSRSAGGGGGGSGGSRGV